MTLVEINTLHANKVITCFVYCQICMTVYTRTSMTRVSAVWSVNVQSVYYRINDNFTTLHFILCTWYNSQLHLNFKPTMMQSCKTPRKVRVDYKLLNEGSALPAHFRKCRPSVKPNVLPETYSVERIIVKKKLSEVSDRFDFSC